MSLVKSNRRRSPLGGSLIEQDPFFSDLFNSRRGLMNLNRLFNTDISGEMNLPALNISEHKKNYEIELAVPGYSKDDFDITMEEGILTITGSKEEENEEKKEAYVRREFSSNSFTRSIAIPENIDKEKDVKASYKDGVLKLVLAKNENDKPKPTKKIKVS